jgi:hypothetical protein
LVISFEKFQLFELSFDTMGIFTKTEFFESTVKVIEGLFDVLLSVSYELLSLLCEIEFKSFVIIDKTLDLLAGSVLYNLRYHIWLELDQIFGVILDKFRVDLFV